MLCFHGPHDIVECFIGLELRDQGSKLLPILIGLWAKSPRVRPCRRTRSHVADEREGCGLQAEMSSQFRSRRLWFLEERSDSEGSKRARAFRHRAGRVRNRPLQRRGSCSRPESGAMRHAANGRQGKISLHGLASCLAAHITVPSHDWMPKSFCIHRLADGLLMAPNMV